MVKDDTFLCTLSFYKKRRQAGEKDFFPCLVVSQILLLLLPNTVKRTKKDVHCFIFSTCFTENYSCVLLYYFYMTRQTFFIHPFKKIIQKACSILKIIITDPPFKKSILLLYIATDAASSATAITIMDVER